MRFILLKFEVKMRYYNFLYFNEIVSYIVVYSEIDVYFCVWWLVLYNLIMFIVIWIDDSVIYIYVYFFYYLDCRIF